MPNLYNCKLCDLDVNSHKNLTNIIADMLNFIIVTGFSKGIVLNLAYFKKVLFYYYIRINNVVFFFFFFYFFLIIKLLFLKILCKLYRLCQDIVIIIIFIWSYGSLSNAQIWIVNNKYIYIGGIMNFFLSSICFSEIVF